jgi:hypothetical protein
MVVLLFLQKYYVLSLDALPLLALPSEFGRFDFFGWKGGFGSGF